MLEIVFTKSVIPTFCSACSLKFEDILTVPTDTISMMTEATKTSTKEKLLFIEFSIYHYLHLNLSKFFPIFNRKSKMKVLFIQSVTIIPNINFLLYSLINSFSLEIVYLR